MESIVNAVLIIYLQKNKQTNKQQRQQQNRYGKGGWIVLSMNNIAWVFGANGKELGHTSNMYINTGCPKINFTFLNVNNVRTNIRTATPAIYIDRGHL